MAALKDILQQNRVWLGGAPSAATPAISTTYAELDRLLPGGGWPTGTLTEILIGRRGIGELQLVLPALAALSWAGKRVAWIAPPHLPYAPALAAAGVDLAQLTVVRAPGRRDALWAAEQTLRSASCHALLAWFDRPGYDALRRLAVAAESSPTWVVLFRAPEAAGEPSPASLRIALEPDGDALSLRILKRRGAPAAAPLRLALKRPLHALGGAALSLPAADRVSDYRGLGLPVHA